MKLTVDGRTIDVAGGTTVLAACRAGGAEVPTLCHDDRTSAGGHCRACLVLVDGRAVAACVTPVHGGSSIVTRSAELAEYRRDLGELMAAESAPAGRAREFLERSGVDGSRYASMHRAGGRVDASHPFLRIDLDRCIRCRVCVHACGEIEGRFVYAMAGRGGATRVTFGAGAFADTECSACGACAQACPTGAITDVDRSTAPDVQSLTVTRTTCGFCGVGCQLDVHADRDDVRFVDAADSPVNRGHACTKGRYAHAFARHPERLTTPLVRKGGAFEPISWEEAIALVAREFTRLRGAIAGLSSSRATNEENYLFQKWLRAGLGTNDVDCCARVCHAPSAAGMRRSFGAGAATNSLADIERADLLLVVGSNTTESHPVTGARVKQAVLAGARCIVIDPRRTELASLADVHLQPRPGTNVPLFQSLAAVIVEEGLFDARFVGDRTSGFEEYRRDLARFAPEATEPATGVAARLVRTAARMYAAAASPMQVHGLGVTEQLQGSEAVMLLCNLALLVGAVGRDGVGVNPLRGQNNVQGAADMGCQPDLLTGYGALDDPAVRARFERTWRRELPRAAGRTLPRIYEAIDRGEIRALFVFGEDVAQTDPDAARVRERLASLEFLVVQELFLSETAKLAHLVLPGASVLEKDGTFTNGERRIQRVRRVLDPPGEARADWRILQDLMTATGLPQAFDGPRAIWDEVRAVAPPFAAASWDRLETNDGAGLQWPVTDAATDGTAILHRERFACDESGRARFARVDFHATPNAADPAHPLLLITGRVLEHYNSGSMTRRGAHASLVDRDRLTIHPSDAAARGIEDGASVVIESRFGRARATARHDDAVAPGTLFLSFHFPETRANDVTSDVTDRISDCPEYKVTAVEVARAASRPDAGR